MSVLDPNSLQRQIQQQSRRVQGLRAAVYAQADPSASDLHQRLIEEEARLRELEQQRAVQPTAWANDQTPAAPRGRFLGPKTTGLQVEPTLNMQPIPTGIYHLLDPETDPLLTVKVANVSRDPRRVCIKAFLEGLSAQAVRTVEVEPRKDVTLKLLPTLLPERARAITEVQRATLHVVAEDLDGKPESHDTFSVVCLARTSSFNAVRRPDTGQTVDLSHYYGAWVTPHDEAVQRLIRRAADLLPDRQILGYQGDPDAVPGLVGALFQALKEAELTYVNSVIDFGAPAGQATQRTRLPRESLAGRAVNCIDGAVLFASLLEGVSLNPALVLVPGHAFVGWEAWDGADEWRFLETTMIGTHDFEAACGSGQRQYDQAQTYGRARLTVHRLTDLRARGIWPME
ncbi:MAG TPA: hypothetical protein VF590_24385 [Isosphaeraceae bacterium]|jgi:hypothetical protein